MNDTHTIKYDITFKLILIYLFFEYIRPQDFLPLIGKLHPGIFLMSIIFLFILFRNKLFSIKKIQIKFLILLILLMTIHIFTSTNNFWAFVIWKNTILYFLVFFSIIHFVDTQEKISKFIDIWIIINVIIGIIGIIQGGLVKNSAFLGDENDFALAINMAIPFAYFKLFMTENKIKRIFYVSAIVIFLSAVVSSFSRGGFIGLLIVTVYCWYRTPKKVLSMLILISFIFLFSFIVPTRYWNEMNTIKEESIYKGTGYDRWYMWKCGWRMFLDNFFLGVGQGNFPWNIEKYEPAGVNIYWHSHSGRPAHSIYITLLSELGLVGFIIFAGIIFSSIRDLRKLLKRNKDLEVDEFGKVPTLDSFNKINLGAKYLVYAIIGSLIAYLTCGIFLSVLYYPHLYILLGLTVALGNSQQNTESIEQGQSFYESC